MGSELPQKLVGEVRGTAHVIDRREGPYGEAVLLRCKEYSEFIMNGCFLMGSLDGCSKRLIVSAALDMLEQPGGASFLIGGLGVGFAQAEASADPRPGRIHVVEREGAVIDWHTQGATPLRALPGIGHDDPRVTVMHDDLLRHLRTVGEQYDALCPDVDNGHNWTVTDDNRGIYGPAGLSSLEEALTDRSVPAV